MANIFENVNEIAAEAVMISKNEMVMANSVDRQHSSDFTNDTGNTIRIRKRVRYAATDGADITGALSDTIEGSVQLVLSQRKVVSTQLTSEEMTLEVDDFNRLVTEPAMVELVQQVENDLHALYKQVWNFTGTPGTTPGTYADINAMRELLDENAAPSGDRTAFYNPAAMTQLGDGLKGVFPTGKSLPAIERTSIGQYALFDVVQSQSIASHTVGNWGGTPLVNGASQEVTYDTVSTSFQQSLITDGWDISIADLLNEGDVFTIAGVEMVNPKTRTSTGKLQNFVVKSVASSDGTGNSTIVISPPIITTTGATPAFATVTAAPADNAAITVVSGAAGVSYPQNLGLHRNAFTLAFANLELPMGGARAARQSMDNVSVRVVFDFDVLKDVNIVRYDILYGVLAQKPEWAVRQTG